MECEECKNGLHKHLDVMKEPWWKDMSNYHKMDSIDCKVIIDESNQCVCHEWKEIKEQILNGEV